MFLFFPDVGLICENASICLNESSLSLHLMRLAALFCLLDIFPSVSLSPATLIIAVLTSPTCSPPMSILLSNCFPLFSACSALSLSSSFFASLASEAYTDMFLLRCSRNSPEFTGSKLIEATVPGIFVISDSQPYFADWG